jgi:hypothetical protein
LLVADGSLLFSDQGDAGSRERIALFIAHLPPQCGRALRKGGGRYGQVQEEGQEKPMHAEGRLR